MGLRDYVRRLLAPHRPDPEVVDRRTTIRFWRVGDQAFCSSCEAEDAPEAELLVVDCAVASVIRCSSCGWALTDVMRGDEVE